MIGGVPEAAGSVQLDEVVEEQRGVVSQVGPVRVSADLDLGPYVQLGEQLALKAISLCLQGLDLGVDGLRLGRTCIGQRLEGRDPLFQLDERRLEIQMGHRSIRRTSILRGKVGPMRALRGRPARKHELAVLCL